MKRIALLFVALLPMCLSAQQSEIGLSVNGWNYQGDIVPNSPPYLPETKPGFGLFYRNTFHNNFAFKLGGAFGQIQGDDRNFDDRLISNPLLKFQTKFFAANGTIEWNIWGRERRNLRIYDASGNRIPYDELVSDGSKTYYDGDGALIERKLRLKRSVSPYLTGGIGAVFFDPEIEAEDNPTPKPLTQKELDQDYSKINFTTPIGAGLKFYLNDRWTLGLEALLIPTHADYLDGFSDSRNPDDNDWLSTASLGLSYRIGKADRDKDGVADKVDRCPDAAGSVNLAGCPDADGDGIPDIDDQCPTQAGPGNTGGCPDKDGDGIADKDDKCPDVVGLKAMNGCPDTDGDGIIDSEDECPTSKGTAANNGCPDTDGDGITDKNDDCPKEAGPAGTKGCPDRDNDGIADKDDRCPDAAGAIGLKGCPDRDKDGVADIDDKCPDVVGAITNAGCPELTKEDKAKVEFAIQNIQFQTNSARLRSASFAVLDDIVSIMNRYPAYSLRIEGHTDSDGSDAANQKLSEGRAKSCYDYLLKKGVAATRMSHSGFGESKPIATNDTADGKRKNRRTNFELYLK
ncbi:MAG: OmpA family protein [Saprospiraceae bacterium]|nr:OmpA family protein [Saprospiraceae bacterium]